MLLAVALAFGHGDTLTTLAISAAPDNPSELWVLTDGWGVLHTEDLGQTWAWHCEEAFGGATPNAVAAIPGGSAVLAGSSGARRLDGDCQVQPLAGLPEGGDGVAAVSWKGKAWVGVMAGEEAGVYACDRDQCAPTGLHGGAGERRFVTRMEADTERLWVSTSREDTLLAELWRSEDGATFAAVASWTSVEAKVVFARGDRVMVWLEPRDGVTAPTLVLSEDGGQRWDTVFEGTTMDNGAPGVVFQRGRMLMGSELGRTWLSEDAGRSFVEVSATEPAVRCAAYAGGVAWICADHWGDGYGMAYSLDGWSWWTGGCLEEAAPASCIADSCADPYVAYLDGATGGGGVCYETPAPAPDTGCGGASILALLPIGWGFRARRRAR